MDANKGIRIFKGATAFITGGASGIGKALAEELSRRGCEVVLADLQFELAEKVAAGIKDVGGKATAVKMDVSDFSTVEQAVKDTFKRTGRLDYIFNNAGIGIGGGVHQYAIDDWNYIVNVNLRGVINGLQAAYPVMIGQGFGHIVNTASFAGLVPVPGQVAYGTTKHAIVGLSISLRAEAALFGIRVSVLCPGFIRTPILEGGKYGRTYVTIPPELMQRMLEKARPMAPDLFAKKALDSVAKNRAIIIEPPWWKWFWRINRLFPEYGITLAHKSFKNTLRELGILPKD